MKRYVEEAGSPAVRRWASSGRAATARLSLVEFASAVARRARSGEYTRAEASGLLRDLEADADGMLLVELDSDVDELARALVADHPLRAGDAVQLASCLTLRRTTEEPVEFVGFDARLNAAARAAGLRVRGAKPSA